MRELTIRLLVGALLSTISATAAYIPTVADFSRCPSIGADTQCGVLLVINPYSSALGDYDIRGYLLGDVNNGAPVVAPFDGSDDTLFGVLNMSGAADPLHPLTSISLGVKSSGIGVGGQPLFSFDGDGLCATSITPHPSGCPFESPADPFGGGTYAGPGTYFAFVNTTASNGHPAFSLGQIAFGTSGNNIALAPDAFAYFSLEDRLTTGACVECTLISPANVAAASSVHVFEAVASDGIPLQGSAVNTAAAAAAPEPSGVALLFLGLLGLACTSARRRAAIRLGNSTKA
jgi:hypothetical protein